MTDDEWLEALVDAMTRPLPLICPHLPTDRLVSPLWECEICG